ncbi:MAG: hypothetical protein ACM3U2_15920 [Deltaproteobacteria bacterium]
MEISWFGDSFEALLNSLKEAFFEAELLQAYFAEDKRLHPRNRRF